VPNERPTDTSGAGPTTAREIYQRQFTNFSAANEHVRNSYTQISGTNHHNVIQIIPLTFSYGFGI